MSCPSAARCKKCNRSAKIKLKKYRLTLLVLGLLLAQDSKYPAVRVQIQVFLIFLSEEN